MKINVDLPPVLYRGKVLRIETPNCISVQLDLRFSVSIERSIVLEGIDIATIPMAYREAAQYFLITLLSKRSVVIHTDDSQKDGFIKGRIFIAEEVRNPPIPLQSPYRCDALLLEVSSFYAWAAERGYDHAYAARLYGDNIPMNNKARKVS